MIEEHFIVTMQYPESESQFRLGDIAIETALKQYTAPLTQRGVLLKFTVDSARHPHLWEPFPSVTEIEKHVFIRRQA